MKYIKADLVLPKELIYEIQKYVQGDILYIPKPKDSHKKWGEKSGGKEFIKNRNDEIKEKFHLGKTIEDISIEYYLSFDSIKKIVYKK